MFYRGNDRHFERHVHMPWDNVSVDLQPDDYYQLNRVLQGIFDDPRRLEGMQTPLQRCRGSFGGILRPRMECCGA